MEKRLILIKQKSLNFKFHPEYMKFEKMFIYDFDMIGVKHYNWSADINEIEEGMEY